MAFKLAQTETFKADVTVLIANDKGGFDKNTFKAIFKRPSTKELVALFESSPGDDDLIRKYLHGWEMTDSETNEAVPFNPENVAALLEITTAPAAVARAFVETVRGARTKN